MMRISLKFLGWSQFIGFRFKTNRTLTEIYIFRNDTHICSASIITEKIVLSAAHCWYPDASRNAQKYPASWFKVAAGKKNKNLDAKEKLNVQIFGVEEIIIDNEYE